MLPNIIRLITALPMNPFVEQLAQLCATHVTRAKWVIVPTHGAGRSIRERIALRGTNWPLPPRDANESSDRHGRADCDGSFRQPGRQLVRQVQ